MGEVVPVEGGTAPVGPDPHPDEHVRFARYRREFAEVAPEDAVALVRRVLGDPDRAMAGSAVCEHLDRRAAELLTDPGFPDWHRELAGVVAVDGFAARRLADWALARAMELDEPWEAEQLLSASNWLQLRTAERGSSAAALTVLAGGGRTRRIRNVAADRLRQVRQVRRLR
ncbi:hypothetical protein GCM10018790_52170 [Kitasatospora xanthocidica]|nr:hypothetical protein GCM10018790_52170 [Kitasatospora xanthocidica]